MNRILISLVLLTLAVLAISIESAESSANTVTRSVFCEEGTATWCDPCVAAGETLYSLYESGDYPFYYVAMVEDKQVNASHRLYDDYNVVGFPTLFFDGGYRVTLGSESNDMAYREAIEACLERSGIPDLDMDITVLWASEGTFNITLEIENNENTIYHGCLRTYVTEVTSRWHMKNGEPYHFAFLDYATNKNISIAAKNTYSETVQWNGTQHGYTDIQRDNIMVIAAVFNHEKHGGYASPPRGNPFDAYYVDYTVAAQPKPDSPPQVDIISGPNGTTGFTRIKFQWSGQDDITPTEDILYSYKLGRSGNTGNWSAWTSVTQVTYENLSDGTYTFQVKAKDHKNQVTNNPAEKKFRVDTGPPAIKQTYPINGEENVPVYTEISIFFTHAMNKTSVETALEIDPSIVYLLRWEETTLVIKPLVNLDYLTVYQVTLGENAKRDSGQIIDRSHSFNFTTASQDITPPTVIATDPLNGQQNVSLTSNITLFFSEPMDTLSVKKALRIHPWFSHQQKWKNNDTELSLLPLNLDETEYMITLLDKATDKAGNNLTSSFVMYFVASRPHILYTIPRSGEQNVSISTDISIMFSQKMSTASLQEMITIDPPVNFTVTQNGNMISIQFSPLAYGTDYTVMVGKDAASTEGSTIGSDYILLFTTERKEKKENNTPSFIAMMAIGGFCIALIIMKKWRIKNH